MDHREIPSGMNFAFDRFEINLYFHPDTGPQKYMYKFVRREAQDAKSIFKNF